MIALKRYNLKLNTWYIFIYRENLKEYDIFTRELLYDHRLSGYIADIEKLEIKTNEISTYTEDSDFYLLEDEEVIQKLNAMLENNIFK